MTSVTRLGKNSLVSIELSTDKRQLGFEPGSSRFIRLQCGNPLKATLGLQFYALIAGFTVQN